MPQPASGVELIAMQAVINLEKSFGHEVKDVSAENVAGILLRNHLKPTANWP